MEVVGQHAVWLASMACCMAGQHGMLYGWPACCMVVNIKL